MRTSIECHTCCFCSGAGPLWAPPGLFCTVVGTLCTRSPPLSDLYKTQVRKYVAFPSNHLHLNTWAMVPAPQLRHPPAPWGTIRFYSVAGVIKSAGIIALSCIFSVLSYDLPCSYLYSCCYPSHNCLCVMLCNPLFICGCILELHPWLYMLVCLSASFKGLPLSSSQYTSHFIYTGISQKLSSRNTHKLKNS